MKHRTQSGGNDRLIRDDPSKRRQRAWDGLIYFVASGGIVISMTLITGSTQEAILAVSAAGTAAAAAQVIPSRGRAR